MSSFRQQGDILLEHSNDDGEINVEGGLFEMSGGLETAAYLSLFGGNEDDDGRDDNPFTWWPNVDETDPTKKYISETQNLLQALPLTSGNLRRVEQAAERDLAWFISSGAASDVTVIATAPGLNRLNLNVVIVAFGEESEFNFAENWKDRVPLKVPGVPSLDGVVSTLQGFALLEDGDNILLESGDLLELEI